MTSDQKLSAVNDRVEELETAARECAAFWRGFWKLAGFIDWSLALIALSAYLAYDNGEREGRRLERETRTNVGWCFTDTVWP